MAAIAVRPYALKNVDLAITVDGGAANDYKAHVSAVDFTPAASTVSWKGLAPGSSFTSVGDPTWVCNLSYAQDWETEDSLSNFLLEHTGDTVHVVFAPVSGKTAFEADIIITPGAIGGAVDTVGVGTVSLGVDGAPAKVAA